MAKKSVIESIGGSIELLIADHGRLVGVCGELTEQRDALLVERRKMQEQITSLEKELAKLQLCEGLSVGDQSRDRARARVNRLMREVDRCIALLNSPSKELADAAQAKPMPGESEKMEDVTLDI
ncbi:MAG: hypothetical protein SNH88_02005 [Rikenellaceae bacterium]